MLTAAARLCAHGFCIACGGNNYNGRFAAPAGPRPYGTSSTAEERLSLTRAGDQGSRSAAQASRRQVTEQEETQFLFRDSSSHLDPATLRTTMPSCQPPSGHTSPHIPRSRTSTENGGHDVFDDADGRPPVISDQPLSPALTGGSNAPGSGPRPHVFTPEYERRCCHCCCHRLHAFVEEAGRLLRALGRLLKDLLWQPTQVSTHASIVDIIIAIIKLAAMVAMWTAVVYTSATIVMTATLVSLFSTLIVLFEKSIEYLTGTGCCKSADVALLEQHLGNPNGPSKRFKVLVPSLQALAGTFTLVNVFLRSGAWFTPDLLSDIQKVAFAALRMYVSTYAEIITQRFFTVLPEHYRQWRGMGSPRPQDLIPEKDWTVLDLVFYMLKLPPVMLSFVLFGVGILTIEAFKNALESICTGTDTLATEYQENGLILTGSVLGAIAVTAPLAYGWRAGNRFIERRREREHYAMIADNGEAGLGAAGVNGRGIRPVQTPTHVSAFYYFTIDEITALKLFVQNPTRESRQAFLYSGLTAKILALEPEVLLERNYRIILFTKDEVKALKEFLTKNRLHELAGKFTQHGELIEPEAAAPAPAPREEDSLVDLPV